MIWKPFGTGQSYQLGIDIGTASIKVVELEHVGNRARLTNYVQYSGNGKGSAIHYSALKILDTQVIAIVRQMLERARISTKEASIAIPLFSSFSTLLELPGLSEDELDQAVQYEARKYIPLPMSEVQFDWIKIEHLSGEQKSKVLAVAVPNEVIEKYYRIAKALGLELKHVELETFSAARALLDENKDPVVLLDIGSRTSNISVVEQGVVVMHHNIDVSGFGFTRTLARGLAVDLERADTMKHEQGMAGQKQVAELLGPLLDKIIAEIEKIVEDYINQGGNRAQKIVMTGGSAHMAGLSDYIQQRAHIPTVIGDSLSHIEVSEELKGPMKTKASSFAIAIGLALRTM
ncbi:MAG: type IV pilus assembly protein PilM [Candidatus Spechtbacterales bacterium]